MLSVAPKTQRADSAGSLNQIMRNVKQAKQAKQVQEVQAKAHPTLVSPVMIKQDPKPITKISLSKEWVLPPRPKPGRKPCEDIPSSKRKAQNRAAQRAFRERRANRVSELEEQIMGMERDRSIQEGVLNNTIKNLEKANRQLREENESLRRQNELLLSRSRSSSSKDVMKSERELSLESLFNLEPQAAVPLSRKRKMSASAISPTSSTGEIDFTSTFTVKKPRKMPVFKDVFMKPSPTPPPVPVSAETATKSSSSSEIRSLSHTNPVTFNIPTADGSSIPFESCGFCSEDSPCVCREIETEHQKQQQEALKEIRLKKQAQDANKEEQRKVKLSAEIEQKEKELIMELTKNMKNEDLSQIIKCNGDPGTCLQCKTDPLSNQFCKTVAEKAESSKSCVSLPSITSMTALSSTRSSSLSSGYVLPPLDSLNLKQQYIPCADAYKTISNHLDVRHVGVSNIANNLHTKGMFVEVGSVVSCLRELDRNFSSGK
jgi:hypothetical protein